MPYDIITGRGEADKKELGDKGLILIGKRLCKKWVNIVLSLIKYLWT